MQEQLAALKSIAATSNESESISTEQLCAIDRQFKMVFSHYKLQQCNLLCAALGSTLHSLNSLLEQPGTGQENREFYQRILAEITDKLKDSRLKNVLRKSKEDFLQKFEGTMHLLTAIFN